MVVVNFLPSELRQKTIFQLIDLFKSRIPRTARLFLRKPSVIPLLLLSVGYSTSHGGSPRFDNVMTRVIRRLDGFIVREEYSEKPIYTKETCGFEICLNPDDMFVSACIGVTGKWEEEVTAVFRRILKPGDIVIDVGANIGWFTLLSAQIVGEMGAVVALEPELKNFALLSKSVERNGFRNVRLLMEGGAESDGTRTLVLKEPRNPGSYSTQAGVTERGTSVVCSKLETIAKRLGLDCLSLVKIDVEGYEPEVVAGSRQLINDGRMLNIVMEWNRRAWDTHAELLSVLFRFFDVYQINCVSSVWLGSPLLRRMHLESLPSTGGNLLMVRKAKSNELPLNKPDRLSS